MILLCMMIFMAGFGYAQQTYTQDAYGFYLYDDFSIFNSTVWTTNTTITNSGGEMQCRAGLGVDTALYLTLTDFDFSMEDEWNITLRTDAPIGIGSSNSYNHWFIQDNIQQPQTGDFLIMFHRLFSTTNNVARQAMRYDNGTGITLINNTQSLANSGFYNGYKNFTTVKTNLPNGSIRFKWYVDGVYFWEATSPVTTDSLQFQDFNFGWWCRSSVAGAGTNLDMVEISYVYETPLITNTPPQITVNNPANETETNTPDDVQFTATDDNNGTFSCSLYVDSQLNQTNSAVNNNSLTTFSMTWDEGMHTFYLTCTDGANQTTTTGTFNYYLDTTDPNINSVTPNIFNTTVFDSYTMNILGNATNTELTNVTRTIRYPNGTVFFNDETTIFGDPTLHT